MEMRKIIKVSTQPANGKGRVTLTIGPANQHRLVDRLLVDFADLCNLLLDD